MVDRKVIVPGGDTYHIWKSGSNGWGGPPTAIAQCGLKAPAKMRMSLVDARLKSLHCCEKCLAKVRQRRDAIIHEGLCTLFDEAMPLDTVLKEHGDPGDEIAAALNSIKSAMEAVEWDNEHLRIDFLLKGAVTRQSARLSPQPS